MKRIVIFSILWLFPYKIYSQKVPTQLNKFGSDHGIELFYVFNTWEDSSFAIGSLFTP